jgi:hypothetical protein
MYAWLLVLQDAIATLRNLRNEMTIDGDIPDAFHQHLLNGNRPSPHQLWSLTNILEALRQRFSNFKRGPRARSHRSILLT